MPFPTKTALGVLGALVVTGITVAVLGGGGGTGAPSVVPAAAPESAVETAHGPILVFPRPDGTKLEVMGPRCYEDTRGNDALVQADPKAATDCFLLQAGGRDLLDLTQRTEGPVYVRIIGQPESYQSIALGAGDSVVEVEGSTNLRIVSPHPQNSILSLPNMTTVDLRFRQQGDDVIIDTHRGTIVLARQTGSSQGPIDAIVLRGGIVLERSQIRVQSVVGQGTAKNDRIMDTESDDVLYPGLGDDTITLLAGRNRIHYEGGQDRINSSGDRESHNALYIPFPRREVRVVLSEDGRDILLETPKGTVRLELQMFRRSGDLSPPIQTVTFSDGPVDAEGLANMAQPANSGTATEQEIERARVRN